MHDLIQAGLFPAEPATVSRLATPHDRAIDWAVKIVHNPNAVYLDTETTGLELTAEVCDIAIVAGDGTVLLDTLVRPRTPIPAEATTVHGITDAMVADAPTFPEIVETVRMLIASKLVVVYNAAYDLPLLNRLCQTHGARALSLDIAGRGCAMLAFSDLDGTLNAFGKPKWHRLDVAAARFGIPPGGHRALGDAETTRLVVAAMAREQIGDRT
jgi:DNA polymerase-3 subunit epsilon